MTRVMQCGFVAFTLLIIGCSPGEKADDLQSVEQPASPGMPVEPVPAPAGQTETPELPQSEVSVQVLDWDQITTLIKQQTGKVVVVDLWATYCPPCVAEFPNLVQLHKQHGDKVTCISVSLDYDGLDDTPISEYQGKVLKFLQKQDARFQNILCATDPETLYNEKLEHSSIPVVFVYNQQGELAGQFPDPKDPSEFTYKVDVLPLVEKLIHTP